jgi:hypothetical protein
LTEFWSFRSLRPRSGRQGTRQLLDVVPYVVASIQKGKGACARRGTEDYWLRTYPLLDRGPSSCIKANKNR